MITKPKLRPCESLPSGVLDLGQSQGRAARRASRMTIPVEQKHGSRPLSTSILGGDRQQAFNHVVTKESAMTRLPMIAAEVLAIAASAPVLSATTTPAWADEWRDRGAGSDDVRDLLRGGYARISGISSATFFVIGWTCEEIRANASAVGAAKTRRGQRRFARPLARTAGRTDG
jgi:hypothetical protein